MPKRNSENDGLLEEEQKGSKGFCSRENLLLLFYVVMAVLVGTTNRVTFKVRIRMFSSLHLLTYSFLTLAPIHFFTMLTTLVDAILYDQLWLFCITNYHIHLFARQLHHCARQARLHQRYHS